MTTVEKTESLKADIIEDDTEAENVYMGYDSLDDAIAGSEYTSQPEVLARMLSRENVFISGPAGSGKSAVVQQYVEIMKKQFGETLSIAVTGTTGFVAASIGGSTIHSWSGVGIGTTVKFVPDAVADTDVLIIDEISMLPAYYLDLVDQACRRAKRKKNLPFGGIQVILLGDFKQLPPVPNRDLDPSFDQRFAYFSEAWKAAEVKMCYLDKIHRSKDPKLTKVLQDIENGTVNQATVDLLRARKIGYQTPDPEKTYTRLYTLNKKVDEINEAELAKNPNRQKTYKRTIVRVGPNRAEQDKAMKTVSQPEKVNLKEGAKVMVTKNGMYETVSPKTFRPVDTTYAANGSVGKVVKIMGLRDPLGGHVAVKLNSGDIVAVGMTSDSKERHEITGKTPEGKPVTKKVQILDIQYMPLRLAYAITVHKSQGQTLDGVIADLSKCFTPGLGYVALSRVSSLDDLIIEGMNKKTFMIDPTSKKISKSLKQLAKQNRKDLLEERDMYETVLENPTSRYVFWQEKLDQIMGSM